MPRVKNVDCVACNQRVSYEYAIHRQTFLHKMHSAKYTKNGSMLYYDSVDLDKSPEKINAQTLRLYNQEADRRIKTMKKQKKDAAKLKEQQQLQTKKKCHTMFEKNRKKAANACKHLQPKTLLNVLQTKLAIEAEMIYQKQMATLQQNQQVTTINVDDDMDFDNFKLTPKKVKNQCLASTNRHTKTITNNAYINFR